MKLYKIETEVIGINSLMDEKCITVIRLKSDNFDCYVSEYAYKDISLQMSSGDYGSHRARYVLVSPNQLENIKYNSKMGYVDKTEDQCFWFYPGDGDCYIEDCLGGEW